MEEPTHEQMINTYRADSDIGIQSNIQPIITANTAANTMSTSASILRINAALPVNSINSAPCENADGSLFTTDPIVNNLEQMSVHSNHNDYDGDNNNNNNNNGITNINTDNSDNNNHDNHNNEPALITTATINNSASNGPLMWQNDSDVKTCSSCSSKFTFFNRKHHCRKCGKIYCNSCCHKYCTYIPGSMVIESNENGRNRIINESYKYFEFRTCNSCYDELLMLKEALGMATEADHVETDDDDNNEDEEIEGLSISNTDNIGSRRIKRRGMIREVSESTTGTGTMTEEDVNVIKHSQPREITVEVNQSTNEDMDECPVCGTDMKSLIESDRENHINACLQEQEFGSPTVAGGTMKRETNRMLVYTIPATASPTTLTINDDNECVICLDDFHPGDKVARLECLCCFHYNCITDWINKKGFCECPVHSLHQG